MYEQQVRHVQRKFLEPVVEKTTKRKPNKLENWLCKAAIPISWLLSKSILSCLKVAPKPD